MRSLLFCVLCLIVCCIPTAAQQSGFYEIVRGTPVSASMWKENRGRPVPRIKAILVSANQ